MAARCPLPASATPAGGAAGHRCLPETRTGPPAKGRSSRRGAVSPRLELIMRCSHSCRGSAECARPQPVELFKGSGRIHASSPVMIGAASTHLTRLGYLGRPPPVSTRPALPLRLKAIVWIYSGLAVASIGSRSSRPSKKFALLCSSYNLACLRCFPRTPRAGTDELARQGARCCLELVEA